MKAKQELKKHSFTLWLLAAVLLAYLLPGPAAKGGFLHGDLLCQIGVFIIFLLQGLSLPTSELTSGLQPKRLHAFVLSWNYLLFPLLNAALLFPLSWILPQEYHLGFWMLAILPTTVSSAITFTAISGGHTANAIFSTVLSNLLAVFIVPSLAALYLASASQASIPLLPLFGKLALLILLPLGIGQIIRKIYSSPASLISKKCKPLSPAIIIFIVHVSFANSVQSGFLASLSPNTILALLTSTLLLLFIISRLVWLSAAWLQLQSPQKITAFYCASQKSIATGLPLLTSIFAASQQEINSAIALIPLMCYHPAQLILAGLLSNKFAQTQ